MFLVFVFEEEEKQTTLYRVVLQADAMSQKGYINWKDVTRVFAKHESCDLHKSTVAALASRVDAADVLSKQAATKKQQNRQYLLKVLSSIQFLACQGLPLCGDGDETDSNLHQLLVFRGEDQSIPGKGAAKVHCPRSPK